MAVIFLGVVLLALLQFGSVKPGTSPEIRKLTKQLNVFRRSLGDDIRDLKNEVLDLQIQLELERDRTSTFEALLNSSGSGLDMSGQDSNTQGFQKKLTKLEKEVEILKQENAVLKGLKDVVDRNEKAISEARSKIKLLNESTTQLIETNGNHFKTFTDLENEARNLGNELTGTVEETIAVFTRAFEDEKKQIKDLRQELIQDNTRQDMLNLEDKVKKILNGSMQVEIDRALDTCYNVSDFAHDLRDDIGELKKDLDASSRKIADNEDTLTELVGCCKAAMQTSPTAIPTSALATTPVPVIKDYTVYALYGEDIAKNIRTGSRVIRGKDWTWTDQDGGGPGTVMSWVRNDPESKEVMVRWDAGHQANYRVGLHGLYDLYIITGGDADHLAGTSTLRFKPIFRADLEAAIVPGTRVIKGEDWSWRVQDGGGPGTVTGWYAGDKSRKEVMVNWDRGTNANYRVGAYGKYDLFLLTD